MDLWNIKDLEPPPILSCKITLKEIDIRQLDIALKNAWSFFESQQHLHFEAALLSRAVYRLKMKFRNSKDFKALEKLCRVLRVYLQINMSKVLKNLWLTIPRNYKTVKTYTLTKNIMDFTLVRIQGLGKILCRILETCKTVSNLMQQRLRLGHFWKIACVVFAAASRIFVITRNMLKYVCELYTSLLPFSSSLINSGIRWLPEEYSFPTRLDEWLNVDWLDLENTVIEIEDDDLALSYFKLADSDDDVEFCDEYILVKDESVIDTNESKIEVDSDAEEQTMNEQDVVEINEVDSEVDVGEVVNVDSDINEISIIDLSKRKKKRPRKKKDKNQENNTSLAQSVRLNDSKKKLRIKKRRQQMRKNKRNLMFSHSTPNSPNRLKRKRKLTLQNDSKGASSNQGLNSPKKKRRKKHRKQKIK